MAGLLFVSLLTVIGAVQATAQPLDWGDEPYLEPETFECEPGEVPSTSIIDKSQSDIRNLLGVGTDRYPDECKLWSEEFVTGEGDSERNYVIEVLKYAGEDWDAVLKVERNGNSVRYAGVDVDGSSVGATDGSGMMAMELPENFTVTVNTSDGELELHGKR